MFAYMGGKKHHSKWISPLHTFQIQDLCGSVWWCDVGLLDVG